MLHCKLPARMGGQGTQATSAQAMILKQRGQGVSPGRGAAQPWGGHAGTACPLLRPAPAMQVGFVRRFTICRLCCDSAPCVARVPRHNAHSRLAVLHTVTTTHQPLHPISRCPSPATGGAARSAGRRCPRPHAHGSAPRTDCRGRSTLVQNAAGCGASWGSEMRATLHMHMHRTGPHQLVLKSTQVRQHCKTNNPSHP